MYKAKVFNKISKKGLDSLNETGVTISDTDDNPDVILLRSHKLHDYQFNDNLKAIGLSLIHI